MRNVRDVIRLKLCFYYVPFVSVPPSHNLSPSLFVIQYQKVSGLSICNPSSSLVWRFYLLKQCKGEILWRTVQMCLWKCSLNWKQAYECFLLFVYVWMHAGNLIYDSCDRQSGVVSSRPSVRALQLNSSIKTLILTFPRLWAECCQRCFCTVLTGA